ncbi:MAG: hypothetical protein LBQ86_08705 [Holophagales bacterium]|jgi:beta-lactamase regulating signal transducer with metallopeptidase domain|nr:hypothetical protein [Holophagales bacterium]
MSSLWQSPEFQRLGWTLLHSLWQGALIFVLAAILLRILRKKSPQTKYLVACVALGAMVALALGTYAYLANQAIPESPVMTQTAAASVGATIAATQDVWLTYVIPYIPWLSIGWMIGILVFSIRLFGGWCWLYLGIKRRAAPAPSEWQWRVDGLSRLLGVARKARLLVSDRVSAPMALGWIAPVVLLPASALLRLSPEALEAVLVHELSHVRRHDFIVNLLQSIAEALFFYHPAAWWLSGQIRELREHCCDDAAVKYVGSPISYASALAALETLRVGYNPPQMAPAANGASLMKRVQRLLCVTEPTIYGLRAGITAAAIFLFVGASALWGFESDNRRVQEPQRVVIKDENKISFEIAEDGKDGKDSSVIYYSNRHSADIAPISVGVVSLNDETWNEPFTNFNFNSEELAESLKRVQESISRLSEGEFEDIETAAKDIRVRLKRQGLESNVDFPKFRVEVLGPNQLDVTKLNKSFGELSKEEWEKFREELKESLKEKSKGLKFFLDGELFDSIEHEVVLVAPGEGVYLSPDSKAKVYLGKRSEIADDRKESVEKEVERLKSLLERLQEKLKDLDAK